MITVDINPRGIDDEYLKCLNFCFSGWGDQRKYDWYVRRKTAYSEPDLIVLKKDNNLAAGCAVTYRKVALPSDGEVMVGIMTGAWTLPPFRKQGYFAQLIEESLRVCALKGGALLLGFTVEERSSFRQLAKAGSALFPTSYIFSTASSECPQTRPLTRVEKTEKTLAKLYAKLYAGGLGYSRFIYASEHEFHSQFINRPNETEIFEDNYGNYGVIEKTEDTDILQLYLTGSDDEYAITQSIACFLFNALSHDRKLFFYSTRPVLARLSRTLGLEVKVGDITALIAEESGLRTALAVADRKPIEHASLLARADSDWFLGQWNLHSGDRA